MRKMHIVIASHFLPPHVGGIEMVAYKQADALIAKGHTVTSLSSNVKGHSAALALTKKHSIVQTRAWNPFESRGVPYPIFSPALFKRTFSAVKHADVVHVHDVFYQTSMVAALAAKVYKKPLFITQHVSMIHHPSIIVTGLQNIVYKTVGRRMYKYARKIYTLNDLVDSFLQELGVTKSKLVTVANGVDTQLFYPATKSQKIELRKKFGLPAKGKLFLFVGRLVPKKGYQLVQSVWHASYGTLVFAGSSTTPSDFMQMHSIHNLGALKQTDLAELYRACDVLVLPSINEGFPMSVQEAMASGMQIITTNDKGYKKYELDPKQIQLIVPNKKALKTAIENAVAMPNAQVKKAAEYCREYVLQNFSWERLADNFTMHYAEALEAA